jgi:hypothetical protein
MIVSDAAVSLGNSASQNAARNRHDVIMTDVLSTAALILPYSSSIET